MRCLGVDLAVQFKDTGLCILEWKGKEIVAEFPPVPREDSDLVEMLATEGDVVGIDVPLGWPEGFADAIHAYMANPQGPWTDATASFAEDAYFRLRETDRVTRSETRYRATKVTPLSVSAEKLGATAMKAAWIMTELIRSHDCEVDRSGMEGRVLEVYPAAAASLWDLQLGRYKNLKADERDVPLKDASQRLERSLQRQIVGLDDLRNEHQLDALICALVALAARRGQTRKPEGEEQVRLASLEGWIHLPTEPLKSIV